MADDLSQETVEAIIDGVVARLREAPPDLVIAPGSRSATAGDFSSLLGPREESGDLDCKL